MKLIQQAMEDHYEGLVDNEGTHDEDEFQRLLRIQSDELRDEALAIDTGMRIERVIRGKIERDEDLTDEEIYIATETIGNLYSSLSAGGFKGFGFETHQGKELNQKEKSKIALEAITNQNAEKASTWKAKFERFNAGLSDYASWFTGNQNKLLEEAKELLAKISSMDEANFSKSNVTDKRVSIALNRGTKNKPFTSYKEVLSALKSFNDSVKIMASVTKYESLAGKDGGKWDLQRLAQDMHGKIVNKKDGKVTYDLNPEALNGSLIFVTVPEDSQSNYIMRNLKSNFVVTTTMSNHYGALNGGYTEVDVRSLSKKEAIEVCKAVISFIETENNTFRQYYKETKIGFMDILKTLGKSVITAETGMLATGSMVGGTIAFFAMYANSLIFRARMQDIISRIHYINRGVIRGLLAWSASSMKD